MEGLSGDRVLSPNLLEIRELSLDMTTLHVKICSVASKK
jgi:hypothetical protein